MEVEKVGKAIAYLRKRAGYTQKDLADRLGVSDKAVSKWERGAGLPDVSLLGKLSVLLDTDTDSLLAGDVIHHHENSWNGLLVLDDNPCGIGAGTIVLDKPLVYYLLSYFLLVGIKTVGIVCPEKDRDFIRRELLEEKWLDVTLILGDSVQAIQSDPAFHSCNNLMVVFGRSFIYGVDMTRFFQRAMVNRDRLTVLALPKGMRDPSTAVSFDASKKTVSAESGDPLKTQYSYFSIPVLFCPKDLFLRRRADVSAPYDVRWIFSEQDVYIEGLDRGFVEIRLDNWDSVAETASLVYTVQKHCGMVIYCIEEVAWRRGMISLENMRRRAEKQKDTQYGAYLLSLCGGKD